MEKISNVENDDDLNNNNNIDNNNNNNNKNNDDNVDNQDCDDGRNQTDNIDNVGEESRDKNSIKSNDDVTQLNSRASLQSKTGVVEKSTLTSPSTSLNHTNGKSTNPFVNYMRDCRKREFPGQSERKNFFQFVATRWRSMSSKQKQSYVNDAAIIKRQKLLEMETSKKGEKRKRLRGEMTMKRAHPTPKKKNNKKLIKPKRREKKKVKRQRLFKHDSESDTASDDSHESSDNESNASDEII